MEGRENRRWSAQVYYNIQCCAACVLPATHLHYYRLCRCYDFFVPHTTRAYCKARRIRPLLMSCRQGTANARSQRTVPLLP